MKKSRFTNEQIAFALRQVESGVSVEEVYRKIGVSQQTFYRWKKKFAGKQLRPPPEQGGRRLIAVEKIRTND